MKWILLLTAVTGAVPLGCSCSDEPEAAPFDATAQEAAPSGGGGGIAGSTTKPDAALPDATSGGAHDATPLDGTGIDPAYAWLFDDAAWKPLATVPPCDVREADLGKVKYPGHNWTACGSGCAQALVLPGSGVVFRGGVRYGTGARPYANDIQVFLTGGVRFPPGVQVAESFRLGTDTPASLIAVYGDECGLAFRADSSTRIFGLGELQGDGTIWLGIAPLAPGEALVWPTPPVNGLGYGMFDFTGGWGALLLGQGSLGVTFDWTTTALQTVYSSPSYQQGVRANGNAVIWEDWSGSKAVVHGWTAAGGSRVLAQGPWDAANMAISDTRIVWMGATGPQTIDGSYDTAVLYWSERKLDPDQIVIQPGPTLPPKVSTVFMATQGKWAALESAAGILVADLDANAIWSIPRQTGHVTTVLAISDTELLLADTASTFQPAQYFDALLRYELAKLPDYAAKLP